MCWIVHDVVVSLRGLRIVGCDRAESKLLVQRSKRVVEMTASSIVVAAEGSEWGRGVSYSGETIPASLTSLHVLSFLVDAEMDLQ